MYVSFISEWMSYGLVLSLKEREDARSIFCDLDRAHSFDREEFFRRLWTSFDELIQDFVREDHIGLDAFCP